MPSCDLVLSAPSKPLGDAPAAINTDDADMRENVIDSCETEWRRTYEERRNGWKRSLRSYTAPPPSAVLGTVNNTSPALQPSVSSSSELRGIPVEDPSVERGALNPNSPSTSGIVGSEKKVVSELIQLVVSQFTLNEEQEIAFRKIVGYSVINKCELLRMFLGGPGGTGKSRVIDALKQYFTVNGESRRFRLASYTGVAARNISGMTLHSALSLETVKRKKGSRNKSKSDLIEMWSGVDFLSLTRCLW